MSQACSVVAEDAVDPCEGEVVTVALAVAEEAMDLPGVAMCHAAEGKFPVLCLIVSGITQSCVFALTLLLATVVVIVAAADAAAVTLHIEQTPNRTRPSEFERFHG
jgi:hypothetical protein